MKLTFLGTAAAEGVPAIWCECEVCAKAKALGGKNIRRRCAYLIDTDTMVDFGPDILWQLTEFAIDSTALQRIVFTHFHSDHLSTFELAMRRRGFSIVSKYITVAGSGYVLGKIIGHAGTSGTYLFDDYKINPLRLESGKTVVDKDMKITAFTANHAPGADPHILSIERADKRIFIANDTGMLSDSVWQQLSGWKFDLVTIDSTLAFQYPDADSGHMGANTVVRFRDKLQELGCIDASTPVYANHFSHNGRPIHTDLEDFFVPKNIQVAYDGMVVEI